MYSTLQLPFCHNSFIHFPNYSHVQVSTFIDWHVHDPVIQLAECWRWGKCTFSTRTDGWVLIRQEIESNPDQSTFQISPPSPWSISKVDPGGSKLINEKSGLTSTYGDLNPPSLIGNSITPSSLVTTCLNSIKTKHEKKKKKKFTKCNTVWDPGPLKKVWEGSEACPKRNFKI